MAFKSLAMLQGVLVELTTTNKKKYTLIPVGTWRTKLGINQTDRNKAKKQAIEKVSRIYGIDTTDDVAEAIFDALSSKKPKSRYLVGTKDETIWVLKRMFSELFQLNYDHKNSHTREELSQLMDETYEQFLEKYGR